MPGHRVEVGPLARMWINDKPLSPIGQRFFADMFGVRAETFRQIGEDPAFSIMGRNVARVEEVYQTLGMIEYWLHELEPGAQTFALPEVPQAGEGIGFTEAPRGALCHYMRVKNGVIDDYAVVAASMWNCSPRDDAGKRGAVEEALIGVPVPEVDSPVNVGRVIRAYDPVTWLRPCTCCTPRPSRERIGGGGEGFLKKALPAPSKPPLPLPKTFDWWGGYAAGVRSGGKPGIFEGHCNVAVKWHQSNTIQSFIRGRACRSGCLCLFAGILRSPSRKR